VVVFVVGACDFCIKSIRATASAKAVYALMTVARCACSLPVYREISGQMLGKDFRSRVTAAGARPVCGSQ
jgi:hypothetical protein